MAGTVKIWWHDGSTLDVRNHPTPMIAEPELGFESYTVSAFPSTSGAAPEDAVVAAIESTINLRYRVLKPGESGTANDPEAKPLTATGLGVATIGVRPGYRISLKEET